MSKKKRLGENGIQTSWADGQESNLAVVLSQKVKRMERLC